MTQVPPTRNSSAIIPRAPWLAATRAARTPPEPAPITNKSTSRFVMLSSLQRLPRRSLVRRTASLREAPLLQLVAHLGRLVGRELVRPFLRELHAAVDHLGLLLE